MSMLLQRNPDRHVFSKHHSGNPVRKSSATWECNTDILHGISADRLTTQGFGETRPIDTNRTPVGRAKNRRVEFHIEKD